MIEYLEEDIKQKIAAIQWCWVIDLDYLYQSLIKIIALFLQKKIQDVSYDYNSSFISKSFKNYIIT